MTPERENQAINVVLVNPEIPQNTGSIARTCAATETPLHIIEPMAFKIDEKRVRRAGLDYWPYVDLHQHLSWENYLKTEQPKKIWMLSKFAERPYFDAQLSTGDAIVFGSETKGLGEKMLESIPAEQRLCIPMSCKEVRSLNLSNAVSIVLYEYIRQSQI